MRTTLGNHREVANGVPPYPCWRAAFCPQPDVRSSPALLLRGPCPTTVRRLAMWLHVPCRVFTPAIGLRAFGQLDAPAAASCRVTDALRCCAIESARGAAANLKGLYLYACLEARLGRGIGCASLSHRRRPHVTQSAPPPSIMEARNRVTGPRWQLEEHGRWTVEQRFWAIRSISS
jgi:hypothetical protein